jgi:beta-N-acetylhexosaminidase
MVGHVAYDALDPGVPASLSPRVIQGLLRQEMGYRGLVITDDLEMAAVSEGRDPVEAAIQAIAAGADMALVGRNLAGEVKIEELLEGLGDAVRGGRLPTDRVAASVRRVLRFKRRWIPTRWEIPFGAPAAPAAARLARRLEALGRGGVE